MIRFLLMTLILTIPTTSYAEKVSHIIDGDTIVVNNITGEYNHPDDTEIIRLYGINTPEMDTVQGKQAKTVLENMLPLGSKVTLIRINKDKYSRTVAIVLYKPLDDSYNNILQETLLHKGIADVWPRYCKLDICDWWMEITGQHLGE